jgi:pimeloyl-ACP methyl ester carboxylesterase
MKQINKMKQIYIHSITKKGGSIMLIILSILLTCILIIAGVLFMMSPGKPEPFVDKSGTPVAGSISEKTFVTIGGIQQGMIIQSKNINNPVLLYLHGGIPDYYLSKKYPTGLEDYFTVVWWDQRGAGLSYNTSIHQDSITLELLISDTKEVTNYLRKRFGQEKIYIMGRSGGSFIGVHVVAQAPELYHAYIGMAQMSDQLESERLAYEFMVEQYKAKGDKRMVRNLESAPVTRKDGTPHSYLVLRDKAMHNLGIGTTREMRSIIAGVFLPSLTCRDYTLTEKINMWRGKAKAGVHPLWDTILATDLIKQVPELKIPVYFFHGRYDYTVSFDLAKVYFEKIKAPLKGFYTFEQSAHSPIFEEPDRMRNIILTDVLTGSNSLADNI